jgi:hypothetical protein
MSRILGTRKAADPAPDVYPAEPLKQHGDPLADGALNDHGLHVEDAVCKRCNRPIRPSDEARRTASGDCVHLCC